MSNIMRNEKNTNDYFRLFANFLKVFSNPRRLAIISSISTEEKNVSQLSEELGLQTQIISQNLSTMVDKGAVQVRKEGKFSYYKCSNKNCCEGIKLLRAGFEQELLSRQDKMTFPQNEK